MPTVPAAAGAALLPGNMIEAEKSSLTVMTRHPSDDNFINLMGAFLIYKKY